MWLPPANFDDFLADDAHRLIVFREASFNGEWSIYDTRNMDAYTTSWGEFAHVAKHLYKIAAAKFQQALENDLDMDLSCANVRYWAEQMVIKWDEVSVRFQKPSTWELYNGFERVAAASSLDGLRAAPSAAGVIPRGKGGDLSAEFRKLDFKRPLPRNRVIPETFLGDREDTIVEESREFRSFNSFRAWDAEPLLYEYNWIAARNLDDFEHGPAETLVIVQVGKWEYEIHSPRTDVVVKATIGDYSETVERLHLEAFEGFRDSLEAELGLDLKAGETKCIGNTLYINFEDPQINIRYEDGGWNLNDSLYWEWDGVKEHLKKEAPQLLLGGDLGSGLVKSHPEDDGCSDAYA